MATGQTFWNILGKQVVGASLRRDYLQTHLRRSAAAFMEALMAPGSVIGEQWDVSVAADELTLADPRQAVVDDGSELRLLDSDGASYYTSVPFANAGGVDYFVGAHYAEIPDHVSQLAEPDVSGETAPYRFDRYTEVIGLSGNPSAVADLGGGLGLRFTLTTLAGPAWAAGKTRKATIWLTNPETGSAEAFATVDIDSDGAALTADVSHYFGQTSPSLTAGDYTAVLRGPVVTTTDISADDSYALLAVVNTGVADHSGQSVIFNGLQWTATARVAQAFLSGLQNGPLGYEDHDRSGMGCYFGDGANQAWNDITLTIPAPGIVKADFGADPFSLVDNAYVWVGTPGAQAFATEADPSVVWTDYQYTPVAPGTFTVCIQLVDALNEAAPLYRAGLTTHIGNEGSALAAGLLPLVEYDWDGAAITAQAPSILEDWRGDRVAETVGGSSLYLSTRGHDGIAVVEGDSYYGRGAIYEYLTAKGEAKASALIGFLRRYFESGGLGHHEIRICAQANAFAHSAGGGTSVLTLGGTGDLSMVGRNVGGVRRVSVMDRANVLTLEMARHEDAGGSQYDQIPAASGKRARSLVGDLHYLGANGKIESRVCPLFAFEGGRFWDGGAAAHRLGPWFYGSNSQGAALAFSPVGPWLWVDIDNYDTTEVTQHLYVPIPFRQRDYLWDGSIYLTCDVSTTEPLASLTWRVIRVNPANGAVTEWVVNKAAAGSGSAGVVQFAGDGKPGADHPASGAADWDAVTHQFALDTSYNYYFDFLPATGGALVDWTVRRCVVDFGRREV